MNKSRLLLALLLFFLSISLFAKPGNRNRQAIEVNSQENPGVKLYENGLSCFDRQQYDSAWWYFNESFEKYQNKGALFFRGYTQLKLGRQELALVDLDELIRTDSTYRHAFYMRGLIQESNGNHEAAVKDFESQMRLLPDYWKSYAACGRSLKAMHRYGEAAQMFGSSNELKFTDSVAVLEAQCYFLNADYRNTIVTADKYAREGEFSAPGLYKYKGMSFFRQGAFQEAITELTISADLDPTDVEAHRMLVETQLILADPEKAVRSAVNYSRYSNNSPDALLTEGICRIVEQKVMFYTDAIAKIKEAMRIDSSLNTSANNAWIAYGYLLSRKEINSFSSSIQIAKRMNTKDPIVLFVQACALADSESNSDLVFRYLELACEGGFPYSFMLQRDPDLMRFEKNETYKTILENCKPLVDSNR